MGLLMKIQFEFKVLNVIEENGVKCYTLQCSSGEFRRIIKARYDESVYIPDYNQQLWNISVLHQTFIEIELASFIMKTERRKV
jgi:uncharacterized membrane-anchored protein